MNGKLCFHCGQEVTANTDYQLIGLDKPYINLILHKECYKTITNLSEYLADNDRKIRTYNEKFHKTKKK